MNKEDTNIKIKLSKRTEIKSQEETALLKQWFSAFLVLRPFNTVPCVVVTPNHKITLVATSYL